MSTSAIPLRQPTGLKTIFFIEMWERFSYYGMRALLVLYLVNQLDYQRSDALSLYGLYTGLVYLTPMIGGALADRYLGSRRAAVIGGALMVLGHFAMAFEPFLHIALGLLIVGNGFFKPNTTNMVGDLYDGEADPRRAGGYSIFYMGINLGAFLAPLVAGTLGQKVGWHYGFGAAGVGMALGLVQLLWGQKNLGRAGLKSHQQAVNGSDAPHLLLWIGASAAFVVASIYAWDVIGPWHSALDTWVRNLLNFAVLVALLAYILKPDSKVDTPPLTTSDWRRVAGIVIVMMFVVAFWTGFEQAGGTMSLFADKQTDRHVLGFEMPASWFQSINPAVIVLMAPVFSILWTRLDQSRYALSDIAKQGLGMIVLGLGFVVMARAHSLSLSQGLVGPQWLLSVYVIHTLGELMVSPVGLSMVSRIAPTRLAAMMMGIWFLSNAAANYLAGIMEQLLEGSNMPLYPFLAGLSIAAGALLILITPLLNRMMGLKKAA